MLLFCHHVRVCACLHIIENPISIFPIEIFFFSFFPRRPHGVFLDPYGTPPPGGGENLLDLGDLGEGGDNHALSGILLLDIFCFVEGSYTTVAHKRRKE